MYHFGGCSGLCKEDRIDGVMNINRVWLIPKDAEKPIDGRTHKGKEQKNG